LHVDNRYRLIGSALDPRRALGLTVERRVFVVQEHHLGGG